MDPHVGELPHFSANLVQTLTLHPESEMGVSEGLYAGRSMVAQMAAVPPIPAAAERDAETSGGESVEGVTVVDGGDSPGTVRSVLTEGGSRNWELDAEESEGSIVKEVESLEGNREL